MMMDPTLPGPGWLSRKFLIPDFKFELNIIFTFTNARVRGIKLPCLGARECLTQNQQQSLLILWTKMPQYDSLICRMTPAAPRGSREWPAANWPRSPKCRLMAAPRWVFAKQSIITKAILVYFHCVCVHLTIWYLYKDYHYYCHFPGSSLVAGVTAQVRHGESGARRPAQPWAWLPQQQHWQQHQHHQQEEPDPHQDQPVQAQGEVFWMKKLPRINQNCMYWG